MIVLFNINPRCSFDLVATWDLTATSPHAVPGHALLGTGAASARPGASREVALSLTGPWRGTLASPGGPLPFTIEFAEPGARPPARLLNGPERVDVTSVAVVGRTVRMRFEAYDAELLATLPVDRLDCAEAVCDCTAMGTCLPGSDPPGCFADDVTISP